MSAGYLAIVLHAHLPYVRHPEHERCLEENWLFEALSECYLPLLRMLDRLAHDQIPFRLTLSLSPTLMAMLGDRLLKERYRDHLHRQIELAGREIARTRGLAQLSRLARFYRHFLEETLATYEGQGGEVLQAFRRHQAAGNLEIITTAATHGFLPLLSVNEAAVRAQVKVGIDSFRAHFSASPPGFWLPECGYYPGLEAVLEPFGIRYFFVDAHGILHADPRPVHGVHAPLDCGNGVAAFGRDPESSHQVWSAAEGYPGDGDYRDYYRDIGFELDLDYLGPYLPAPGIRSGTGFKYHRVTGKGEAKALYDPVTAREKARRHAEDFVAKKCRQAATLGSRMDRPPIIVAPYDAELFGHWWFEGPLWLEQVIRLASRIPERLALVTCSDYLQRHPPDQKAAPSASSWGEQGYSRYWINERNQWIYPQLHRAGEEMERLARRFRDARPGLPRRALNQAARSLLLAQASDWPFMLKSGTATRYARNRVVDHLARFNYLADAVTNRTIDERVLTALETLDNPFPEIDFRDFLPDDSV